MGGTICTGGGGCCSSGSSKNGFSRGGSTTVKSGVKMFIQAKTTANVATPGHQFCDTKDKSNQGRNKGDTN
ncbi:hypothetical protein EPI10_019263 [Gossypium australe]|uniref:Uncharacterized protein n=1 Tax=Gossypium australe TaxID=47621 RepID=A0A5B6WBJ9_9ROSI|nr:hypothetical protein EPI10_019263 [Gossypium australe]